MRDILLGTLAGFLGTAPMTWTMKALHRQLPAHERYPLAPRLIAMRVAEKAGIKQHMDEDERRQFTMAAHFGMGTSMGALYGAVGHKLPLPAPIAGAAFGLAVWAGNYLGLLPALDLLRPATEHPPRRTGLMIAAHLVWGATTGAVLGCLTSERTQSTTEG